LTAAAAAAAVPARRVPLLVVGEMLAPPTSPFPALERHRPGEWHEFCRPGHV